MYTIHNFLKDAECIGRNMVANKVNTIQAPFYIIAPNGNKYYPRAIFMGTDRNGEMQAGFEYDEENIMNEPVKDDYPEHGEYFKPYTPGNLELSGVVASDLAGERLLCMVKKVLKRRHVKSEFNVSPTTEVVYFTFSMEEFDCDMLYNMTCRTGVVTEGILKQCKQ